MKKYLKEFSYKEVIDKLQNGEVIYHDIDEDTEVPYKFFMYNGVLCWEDESKDIHVGISLGITELNKQCYFNETEEPFEIKETGLYKTRDGRKAFVCEIDNEIDCNEHPIKYVIEDCDFLYTTSKNGMFYKTKENKFDIVSKWED